MGNTSFLARRRTPACRPAPIETSKGSRRRIDGKRYRAATANRKSERKRVAREPSAGTSGRIPLKEDSRATGRTRYLLSTLLTRSVFLGLGRRPWLRYRGWRRRIRRSRLGNKFHPIHPPSAWHIEICLPMTADQNLSQEKLGATHRPHGDRPIAHIHKPREHDKT